MRRQVPVQNQVPRTVVGTAVFPALVRRPPLQVAVVLEDLARIR